MYEQLLSQIGLSRDQAQVYEILIQKGPLSAGRISLFTPLKRGMVYVILQELVTHGLVEKKDEPCKVAIFIPVHPAKLNDVVTRQQEKAKQSQVALEGLLPKITSDFNLTIGKPGVRFYEGLEGIKKVLNDTLINNTKRELRTFSDVGGYATYLSEWNTKHYAVERKKRRIMERVIIPNDPVALEYMRNYKSNEVTKICFIDHKLYPFTTEINIYSNKVSFVTFSEKMHIGVIVENEEIYNTLGSIFEFTWKLGRLYGSALEPEWLKGQGIATRV